MQKEAKDFSQLSEEDHARLAHLVMQKQAKLSLRVAIIFLVMVLGLPLFNYFLPALANTQVLGFTATWLFLGVLFFPITWILSAYFIRESNQIEDACQDWRTVLDNEANRLKEEKNR